MSSRTSPAPGSRRPWAILAVIALAVVAVFARSVGHEFLNWDDLVNTVGNPHVNPPSLEGTLFFWQHGYMDLYVPVTYTLWAILARIALEPWVYHAVSVLLHAGAAVAVFFLLRRLVHGDRAACLGALLFALHPVQVEAVGWMSGMKDLLCGLFAILALGRWVDFARSTRARGDRREDYGRGRLVAFASASVLYLLALLSKPAAVAVPLVAAVIDLALLRRRAKDVARDLAPWAAIAIVWIFVTRSVQPAAGVTIVPVWARLLVAADALGFYLGKLVLPFSLAPDHGREPGWVLEHGQPWLTGLAPLAIGLSIVILARRRSDEGSRTIAAAAGIFAAGVAPVLGLVPFDFQRYSTVADHYLYLSMIGPALLLAWFLGKRGGHATYLAAAGVLALLAAKSAVQVGVWKDDLTLYGHTLEVNPRSWVAHDNLGAALATRGRIDEAIAEYEAALAINPRDARTHFNLGTALDELDRTAEALPHLEEAVRLAPRDRVSRENIAIALLRLERPAEAEAHLREALAIEPQSWLAHYYLAGALDRLGRTEEMLEHLKECVRLEPRFAPARRDLEAVQQALGGAVPK